MAQSEQINELAAALSKAQGALKSAKKDSKNPYFKSDYADLASVVDACREPLAQNGLAVVQAPSITDEGRVRVETLLLHSSGQWLKDAISAMPKDDGPQAIGSIITYLRRYALAAMVGVAPADDDAEKAEGRLSGKTAIPAKPEGYGDVVSGASVAAKKGTKALMTFARNLKGSPAFPAWDYLVKHDPDYPTLKALAVEADTAAGAKKTKPITTLDEAVHGA